MVALVDDGDSFSMAWDVSLPAAMSGTPLVSRTLLEASAEAVFFGCLDGKVYGVSNDVIMWQYDAAGAGFGMPSGSPVIGVDGSLFIGTDTGKLVAIRPVPVISSTSSP